MRKCCSCKQELPLCHFSFRNKQKGIRQKRCKACQNVYRKQHYENNKQAYFDKNKRNWIRRKKEFYAWLKQQSCTDCGITDFRVLELDHLSDKEYSISRKVGHVKLEVLMKEIAKCEVVCANCHKIRTADRANQYSYLDE